MLPNMIRVVFVLSVLALLIVDSLCWLSPINVGQHSFGNIRLQRTSRHRAVTTTIHSSATSDWVDLTDDGGVQKCIKETGTGDSPPESGSSVTIEYTGTLASTSWSVDEVIACWLSEQQGLDDVVDSFREQQIDESKLTDPTIFNEDFVADELGVTAKIKCKKLVMAAKRLATSRKEFEVGTTFDSNSEYEFVMGKNKLIRGMGLAVSSMKVGEVAEAKIRSDYAYGSEGYRKSNGDIVVPPYATLLFEIKLLS